MLLKLRNMYLNQFRHLYVVIDVSESTAINNLFMAAEEIELATQVDGVKCHLTLKGLREATLKSRTVFAARIPESLYWMERRHAFRVPVPIGIPVKCLISLESKDIELSVMDLSIGGLALLDKLTQLDDSVKLGDSLEECRLVLPEQGILKIVLKISQKIPFTAHQDRKSVV